MKVNVAVLPPALQEIAQRNRERIHWHAMSIIWLKHLSHPMYGLHGDMLELTVYVAVALRKKGYSHKQVSAMLT